MVLEPAIRDASINNASEVLPNTKFTFPTLATGFTNHNSRTNYCKIGNVVYLNIGALALSAITTQTTIFQLPSGYRPVTDVTLKGIGYGYADDSNITITTAGDVKVYSTSSYAGGSVAFVANT